jgi:pimeloyl-ACP methyl ester carboxylesterase
MFEPILLDVKGHKIAALSFNQDKSRIPIVFIHGIGSSVYFWAVGQTPLVKNEFPWYSISLPGHYPAVFPTDFRRRDLNPTMITDVLTTAIRELVGDRKVILIGHSTGGFAALNIAAQAPDLVHAVASVSGFVQGTWIGVLGMMQWLARHGTPGEIAFRMGLKSTTLTRGIYQSSLRFYAADAEALYANPALGELMGLIYPAVTRLSGEAMLHYFNRMPDIDTSSLVPTLSIPVLALAGDQDPIVPVDQARLIATAPCGELALIPGAGHLPMAERSDVYHYKITDWLMTVAP